MYSNTKFRNTTAILVIHFARTAPAGASRWNIDIIDETSFADLHPANSENRLLVYFEDEHPIPVPIVVVDRRRELPGPKVREWLAAHGNIFGGGRIIPVSRGRP